MKRKIWVIDPLESLYKLVKSTIEDISINDLELDFMELVTDYDIFIKQCNNSLMNNEQIGIICPLNRTSEALLLNNFRKRTNDKSKNSIDLMAKIKKDLNVKYRDKVIPIIVPFLFVEQPNEILEELNNHPELNYCLACLTKHIIGIDPTYTREQILAAFYKHLLNPIKDNYLMKDYIPKFNIK